MLDLESYREANAKYRENVINDILKHNPQAILVENMGTSTSYQIYPNMSSASRVDMAGTHIEQGATLDFPEKRKLFTGNEREYAKYMFNVKVMQRCIIRKIIHRREFGSRSGKILATYVIVEIVADGDDNGKIDIIEIPTYVSHDHIFGYDLKIVKDMRVDMALRPGDVLAEAPSVLDGEWCAGTHANTILASNLGGIEDACIISDRLATKMGSWGYAKHRIFIGDKQFPLFLYGTRENPEIIPRVGERVRDDGILMATRKTDPLMGSISTTRTALSQASSHYDRCVYVDANSIVVDIKIYRARQDEPNKINQEVPWLSYCDKMSTPVGVQGVCDMHANSLRMFNADLRKTYLELQNKCRSGDLELTYEANTAVTQAIAYEPRAFMREVNDIRRRRVENLPYALKRFGNNETIDDYMIEVTVKFPLPACVSTKMTDLMGGKGEVAQVVRLEEMPYDKYGNRVDLIMSENALFRRTNFNRAMEHFLNAARRDVQVRARELYADGDADAAFDMYIDFSECVNPRWAKALLTTHETKPRRIELLDELDREDFRIWVTVDNVLTPDEIVRRVIERHCPRRSTLTITNPDGSTEETINEFIVGELYVIRLNKTGREFSAISAAKYQAHGTIAKASSSEKSTRPVRINPIRVLGQSEYRHLAAYISNKYPADIKDKSNNPAVQDVMITNLLTAEDVMNITEIVSRKDMPLGHSREMVVNNHIMACDGIAWTTDPDE